MLSQINNPEQQTIAEIERLEMESRNARRRIEHARTEQDKRVLNHLLEDTEQQIQMLRQRLT